MCYELQNKKKNVVTQTRAQNKDQIVNMDVPQYQVPQGSIPSYRFMRYPLPKGLLQELYPGQLMMPYYHFTGDNIPAAPGAALTQSQLALLSKDAALSQEAMNRKLGGIDPVFDHASIEPENPVEVLDPIVVTSNNLGTRGQSDISQRRSALGNVHSLYEKGGIDNRMINDLMLENSDNRNYSNKNYNWRLKELYDGHVNQLGGSPVTGGGINLIAGIIFIGIAVLVYLTFYSKKRNA